LQILNGYKPEETGSHALYLLISYLTNQDLWLYLPVIGPDCRVIKLDIEPVLGHVWAHTIPRGNVQTIPFKMKNSSSSHAYHAYGTCMLEPMSPDISSGRAIRSK